MGAGIMVIMKNAPVTSAIFLCELTWTPLLDEVNDGRLPPDVVASPTLVQRHAPANKPPPLGRWNTATGSPPYGRLSAPLRVPAHLLGGGLVELGASRAGCGFRGLLSPFGEERVAQPGQREPLRHPHVPLERVREQRHRDGSKGPCDCE